MPVLVKQLQLINVKQTFYNMVLVRHDLPTLNQYFIFLKEAL